MSTLYNSRLPERTTFVRITQKGRNFKLNKVILATRYKLLYNPHYFISTPQQKIIMSHNCRAIWKKFLHFIAQITWNVIEIQFVNFTKNHRALMIFCFGGKKMYDLFVPLLKRKYRWTVANSLNYYVKSHP